MPPALDARGHRPVCPPSARHWQQHHCRIKVQSTTCHLSHRKNSVLALSATLLIYVIGEEWKVPKWAKGGMYQKGLGTTGLDVEPCLWPAKQVCSIGYHVIKHAELVGHSLIQCFLLTHCYTLYMGNNIYNSLSLFICAAQFYWGVCVAYLLVFWFDILRAIIGELNRASRRIAANSEYFEVFIVSIVMMLWASGKHNLTTFTFHIIYLSLSWITCECCSHNYASPWANQRESWLDDPQHNSSRDFPFD